MFLFETEHRRLRQEAHENKKCSVEFCTSVRQQQRQKRQSTVAHITLKQNSRLQSGSIKHGASDGTAETRTAGEMCGTKVAQGHLRRIELGSIDSKKFRQDFEGFDSQEFTDAMSHLRERFPMPSVGAKRQFRQQLCRNDVLMHGVGTPMWFSCYTN